jgi:hypothetical protein
MTVGFMDAGREHSIVSNASMPPVEDAIARTFTGWYSLELVYAFVIVAAFILETWLEKNAHNAASLTGREDGSMRGCLYRFSSNVPFLELGCPLSGAIDIGISHSLYKQAPKKAVLYENQYI